MVNISETVVQEVGVGVKNGSNKKMSQLADTKVGWLKILRDEVTDYELCERHINKLDIDLQAYYQGKPDFSVDYKQKVALKTELKNRQACTLRYLGTLLNEVNTLSSHFNIIIVEYLRNPDLSIRGLAKELDITPQEIMRTLERYNRELDGQSKGERTTSKVRDFISERLPGCLV